MPRSFSAEAAARYVYDAHAARLPYQNLPPEIAPATVDEAYAVQEALAELLVPRAGAVAGLKIAVATKVMQELMGIDRPCGGMIFARRIHDSPAEVRLADHVNVVIEFELAVRLGRDLPRLPTAWTADLVRPAIDAAMPAFELVEDRHAVYREANALSIIADNCWNAGIVLGAPVAYAAEQSLAGVGGSLEINGRELHRGATEEPLTTLAWLANLAAERGRPMRAGMVVITGSIIPTLPIRAGDRFVFRLQGLGSAEIATA